MMAAVVGLRLIEVVMVIRTIIPNMMMMTIRTEVRTLSTDADGYFTDDDDYM